VASTLNVEHPTIERHVLFFCAEPQFNYNNNSGEGIADFAILYNSYSYRECCIQKEKELLYH